MDGCGVLIDFDSAQIRIFRHAASTCCAALMHRFLCIECIQAVQCLLCMEVFVCMEVLCIEVFVCTFFDVLKPAC